MMTEPTIRLLMDWPIKGLHMRGWIVQKDVRTAAALVRVGLAEYVLPGTPPHPDQSLWALGAKQDHHSPIGA